MYWADRLAQQVPGKKAKHRVDDMKTVSGMPHVGSLRAVTTHDLVYKAMKDAGFNVDFTYVINDMDPMDGLPVYLDEKIYRPHMGKPLYQIPSPVFGYESYGQYYALKYQEAFNKIGCQPQLIWSHEVYKSGKMNPIIRIALDNADKITRIYKKVAGQAKPKNWHPYQVICPLCGKVGSTLVTAWDGELVTFECCKNLVKWAVGCGYKGRVKPINENGKLMWKVDWPAHWRVLDITVEGAGKEHFSEGGSRDIGVHICKEVFKTKPPFGFLHEFFLVGGRKMSSSKGVGVGADKITEIIPPFLVRFLIAKTPIRRAINFDPQGETTPNLFDDYDLYAKDYYEGNTKTDFGRVWQLSQVEPILKTKPFFPRFRDVANYMQNPSINIFQKFVEIKGSELTKEEKQILEERIKYAKIWLKDYAPKDLVYQITKEIPKEAYNLSTEQKKYLQELITLISKKQWQPDILQQQMYELTKKLNISTKLAFQAIYLSLIGKTHGPKAAWFILEQDKGIIVKRFKEVGEAIKQETKEKYLYPILNRPDIFTIDEIFKKKYPSVTIGLAIIKDVVINKENNELQKQINEFVKSQAGLTTQQIGEYPEIQSYRRIYKETGIDWHSKRPSPEGLLRRIALGKSLSTINTCVDAYNLIVMKHHVSCGAFDLDKIKFPTTLRFTKRGDKITLLGDKKPTFYQPGEVAYFDQVEGYNIDFNYLDAERTKVTESTKNLFINVDGIYNITREQVEKTLKETIDIIIKYCGGKVEIVGIVK